jgi:hypothetical protein
MVTSANGLGVDVCKALISLYTIFPTEMKACWTNVTDMHQWFILCGVDESLTPNILVNVIRRANTQGKYLTRRMISKISTYRAVELEHESGAPN